MKTLKKLLNLTRIGTQLHRLWLCISFLRVLLIATLSMGELGTITLILFKNYQRMFMHTLWVIENYTLPLPTQFSSCRIYFTPEIHLLIKMAWLVTSSSVAFFYCFTRRKWVEVSNYWWGSLYWMEKRRRNYRCSLYRITYWCC